MNSKKVQCLFLPPLLPSLSTLTWQIEVETQVAYMKRMEVQHISFHLLRLLPLPILTQWTEAETPVVFAVQHHLISPSPVASSVSFSKTN